MCSHKHTTIVHRHLYNIKGVIYKSTGIVHSAGPAGAPLQDFPPRWNQRTKGDKAGMGWGGGHLCACCLGGSGSGGTPRGQSLLESGA